jgi:hypothetical protein
VRCHFLLEEQPGEHGSADYRKRHVAHEAWRLLKRNGLEPAGGAQGSLYGNVTTMLWEATTGEVEKDLRAARKAALRAAQAGELRTDGPVMGRGQFPLS